jgi:hypothetical protein
MTLTRCAAKSQPSTCCLSLPAAGLPLSCPLRKQCNDCPASLGTVSAPRKCFA